MALAPGNHRFSITLTGQATQRLDDLRREIGISRSALISLLIKTRWEEVHHTGEDMGEDEE